MEPPIKEFTLVEIDGEVFDLEDCLLSWKRDIASIVYDAKAKQQREVQDRKGKQVEAMTIFKRSCPKPAAISIGWKGLGLVLKRCKDTPLICL